MEKITGTKAGADPVVLELPATLNLFGFPPGAATVRALPRGLGWRGMRASAFFAGGLLLAPIVGIVPPHAPWVAGALGIGGFLGTRKWRERFTLVHFQGRCPNCGGGLHLRAGIPLRPTHSVPCDGCHHDASLSVELARGGERAVGASSAEGRSVSARGDQGGVP